MKKAGILRGCFGYLLVGAGFWIAIFGVVAFVLNLFMSSSNSYGYVQATIVFIVLAIIGSLLTFVGFRVFKARS